ncbi:MAG: DNA/RNA non-specific endonuclease [Chitinophagales bacterium]
MKKYFIVLLLLSVTASATCQILKLKKQFYTIYFHEKQKIPLYTVYTLKKSFIVSKPRKGDFKQDSAVNTDKQASDATYDDPDYDKGHFTPDADFRFNDDAEAATFLYTNAAPQQDYFNEHLWANLEKHVRDICSQNGDVKVFTGCMFGAQKLHGIDIPAYFWKVIIYKVNGQKVKEAYKSKNKKPASNVYTTIKYDFNTLKQETGLSFN